MTTDDAIMNIVRECQTEADVYRAIQESHELLRQAGEALRALKSAFISQTNWSGDCELVEMVEANRILTAIDARAK